MGTRLLCEGRTGSQGWRRTVGVCLVYRIIEEQMKMMKGLENGTDNLSRIYERHDELGVAVDIVFFWNM